MSRTPWTTPRTDDETDRWDAVADETAADRTEVEIGIATLKIVATETALDVAHRVFEVTGSSSTRSNVRTHSLHDPVDYKKIEVGAHHLTGDVQPITLYT